MNYNVINVMQCDLLPQNSSIQHSFEASCYEVSSTALPVSLQPLLLELLAGAFKLLVWHSYFYSEFNGATFSFTFSKIE